MKVCNFHEVVLSDKAANRKGQGAWAALVSFVANAYPGMNDKGIKEELRTKEKTAKEDDKWEPSGAYRSSKSLILRASRLGVKIVQNDEVRGKSDVQDECNELEKTEKTAGQKFTTAINTANSLTEKMNHGELIAALALTHELLKKLKSNVEKAQPQEQKAA